ncbi:hypothetical protein [Phenylobacterium immobile]|uniref:hypothetical protein n=1 Tax=Phenylobacterium immobile TaxID=21 RepID=UPI000AFED42D|nr:hypothetical protein [Phenylobacterium immobile]
MNGVTLRRLSRAEYEALFGRGKTADALELTLVRWRGHWLWRWISVRIGAS